VEEKYLLRGGTSEAEKGEEIKGKETRKVKTGGQK
jgi:hypothetical protein